MSPLPTFHAMVLSAGFGTRLSPLTLEIPKPMVPIGFTPLMGIHLQNLHEQGAAKLVVNTHHHAEEISRYISKLGLTVHVEHEVEIRGTAGGVAGVRSQLRGAPAVLVNGDIVGDIPLRPLLEASHDGLTMAVFPRKIGEGTVGIGSDGQVVRLRGEDFGVEVSAGDYMGVCCLGSKCLESLPEMGCLVGDWALPELRRGTVVRTVSVLEEFEDIGTPFSYWKANMAWLHSRPQQGPGGSFVSAAARLSGGVRMTRSIVGEGASVLGSGVVEECVILPGAQVEAPLRRAIVTPAGVIIQVQAELGSEGK